ncbi:MAG: fatty acid desaturase [Polyangiales bacterium]
MGAPRFRVPAEKSARFRALARVPGVAAPTLAALLAAVVGLPCVARSLVTGALPAPAAVACATALMYGLFTVIHDAIHGSFARRRGLNDALGSLGLLLLAPHASLGLFRWAHLQHHRHTNGPRDPDAWSHEGGLTLPLRWATIDAAYVAHVLRAGDAAARRHLLRALPHVAATLAAVALLVHAGYGREVVLLWLIPSRLTFVIAGCLFFWLPHVGAETTADEDVLRATTLRLGHERLLTPLLQFQNYHLVHHLFPALPSRRHAEVYRLLEADLRARPLLIQRGFAVRPAPTVAPVLRPVG